jgi:NADPH-dependent 2,4-dienoyl-CoA reductase/sulfur reductase-like enzyme
VTDEHAVGAGPELVADVVIVGAGPAGLAAALAAVRGLTAAGGSAEATARVVVLDAAPAAGGQIWRARRGVVDPSAAPQLDELGARGVRVLAGTRVVAALPERVLLVEGPEGPRRLRWQRLVLAAGARERLLPFPGWTLPGVFGAGGLQALAKGGWPVAGRRVLVAGTGPLLLAAAATLRRGGARVVGIADEASTGTQWRFAAGLLAHPAKAVVAARLGAALAGVRRYAGMRVVAAEGDGRIECVVLAPTGGQGGARVTLACDALAAGWGLLPVVELARMLGCALAPRFGAPAVMVDEAQRTSVSGVYAAGEQTGVAGVVAAVLQGRLAGAAAARDLRGPAASAGDDDAQAQRRALAREHRFAAVVARAFPPPTDLAGRLSPDTLVCRCEDVPWAAVREQPDLRAAKLATRCGMGHCQGRLCHDAIALATGAATLAPHLPLMPVALGTILVADAGLSPDPSPHAESLP